MNRKLTPSDESYHVCHRGYISLFPFLLGLIPADSPHLKPTLDIITDPNHLWSPYGIRSLSKSHELFGKDENYWRGPIWVQMNWLALKALKEQYMVDDGPQKKRSKQIYDDLRKNIVDNVFNVRGAHLLLGPGLTREQEWQRTGYSWEQYDAETGEGRRRYVFLDDGSRLRLSQSSIHRLDSISHDEYVRSSGLALELTSFSPVMTEKFS